MYRSCISVTIELLQFDKVQLIQMLQFLNCNLTQYTNFRQLQLQYLIVKQQKQQLFNQFSSLSTVYQEQLKQLNQIKNNKIRQTQKSSNQRQYKTELYELQNIIDANFQYLDTKFSFFSSHQQQIQSYKEDQQKTKNTLYHKYQLRMQRLTQQFTTLKQFKRQTIQKQQKLIKQLQKSNRQKHQTENLLNSQVQHLKTQIDQLYFTMEQLNKQNKETKKQNKYLQSYLTELQAQNKNVQRKYKKIQENKNSKQEQTEDNAFALDLIIFQKDFLQKLYQRVANCTKNNQLSELMNILFNQYEQMGELFKQKLQIQYDLQQLQGLYKSDKNGIIQQNILIQMRKQIQIFRIQLVGHREKICEKQLQFQNYLVEFQNEWVNQLKLRNYSTQIQRKIQSNQFSLNFRQNKNRQFQNVERELKRHKNQKSNKSTMSLINKKQQTQSVGSRTVIKFRGSGNAEQIMKEIVKKDRQNLQKILLEGKTTVYNS